MKVNNKIRVLLVSDTPGHSTGYHIVAKGMREAGIEVILGGFQIPSKIVESALQEDVDFIGYRIMDGAPEVLVPILMNLIKDKSMLDTKVILGGIIPPHIHSMLKDIGVCGIFTPGTNMSDIVNYIKEN
ncbi:MAG: cobalamin-dependent protein [Spirochaetota bacterium]|nr:cobalamin-dependent protein [Spirochaetota bacterium]